MKTAPKNTPDPSRQNSQFGGGLLSVVATAGVAMVLMQGTMFYKSKEGAKFLSREKAKVLAAQLAEAGVEETIAEIGQRNVVVTDDMHDHRVFEGRSFGGGNFSTSLTTVARGLGEDTVDLVAHGQMAGGNDRIDARLRLRNAFDTSLSITLNSVPITMDVTVTDTLTLFDTTVTTRDPESMPPLETQPAYTACQASASKKCDICHVPPGNVENRQVINVNKHSIDFHIDCHGDYVTTDGTCDLYNPVETITSRTVYDTHVEQVVTNLDVFDTALVIDTLVKVQVLSWK